MLTKESSVPAKVVRSLLALCCKERLSEESGPIMKIPETHEFEATGWIVHRWRYKNGEDVTVLQREPFRISWFATRLVTYVPVKHQWDHSGHVPIPLNNIQLRPQAPGWRFGPTRGYNALRVGSTAKIPFP